MEFSPVIEPSDGPLNGAGNLVVLGTKHGAMSISGKDICATGLSDMTTLDDVRNDASENPWIRASTHG